MWVLGLLGGGSMLSVGLFVDFKVSFVDLLCFSVEIICSV